MKLTKILNSLQAMERLIRDRKQEHRDEDEKATLMGIRVPLTKALGSTQLADTLLQHEIGHQIYLKAAWDLPHSKAPGNQGPGDSAGRAVAKPQAPEPTPPATGTEMDL
jgi:hypothetical protein